MNTSRTIPKSKDFTQAANEVLEIFRTQNFPEAISYSVIRKNKNEKPVPFDSYSLMNKLRAIYIGHTTDCRGYASWQSCHRSIIKGRKSFSVIAPCTYKIKAEDSADGKEHTVIKGFKAVPVFAYEDTEGEPIDIFDYTPDYNCLPPLFEVAEAMGIKTNWRPISGKGALGWYNINNHEITMTSLDALNFYHELAHAVHDSFEPLKDIDLNKAEAVAETSACCLTHMLGIESYHISKSYEYIRSYCDDSNPNTVLKKVTSVLNTVEKVVTIILDKAAELEVNNAARKENGDA